MPGYYDFVLLFVPVSLLGLSGAFVAGGFATTTAIPLAGLVAAAIIGHGLFVNAPVSPPTTDAFDATATDSPVLAD